MNDETDYMPLLAAVGMAKDNPVAAAAVILYAQYMAARRREHTAVLGLTLEVPNVFAGWVLDE